MTIMCAKYQGQMESLVQICGLILVLSHFTEQNNRTIHQDHMA